MFRFILVLTAIAITACSAPKRIDMDYDTAFNFSGLKYYSWPEPVTEVASTPDSDKRVIKKHNTPMIQKTIADALSSKGFRFVEGTPPDFSVRYQIEQKTQTEPSPVSANIGFGRSTRSTGIGVGIGLPIGGDITSEVITVTIDVLSKKGEVVWRGVKSGTLPSASLKSEKTIRSLIDKILAEFPPE